MASSCCPNDLPPLVSNYQGKGQSFSLKTDAGLAYFVGSGERAVLHIPDIFGMHPNHYQVADIIASQGFSVLLVDPFYGKPVPRAPFPPAGGWPEVMVYVNTFTWKDKVRPVLMAGIAELQKRGAKQIGALGLCWGGLQAFYLSAEKIISVVATAHPSDDPEWKDLEEYFTTKSAFAKQNVYQRFPDMKHGWLGAKGSEWGSKAFTDGVTQGLHLITDFFKTNI